MALEAVAWFGIVLCVSQSAMFSGLNLAMFGVSRLRLEVEVASGNQAALRVRELRRDSNFLLTTILWGNVSINVLLTLLSNSVLAGVAAFLFSTVIITVVGEIVPQAYFSRNALRLGALLAPVLRVYQFVLYPVAKPTAKALDLWLGEESIQYFREHQLRQVIREHVEAGNADIDKLEGLGALNFLALDDLLVTEEGELVDPSSIITLPVRDGRTVFPSFDRSAQDEFLLKVHVSGKKWIIITDSEQAPQLVLDSDAFLRDCLFESHDINPYRYCHRPIVVEDSSVLIGNVLGRLRVFPRNDADDVVEQDIILVWTEQRRIITGSDILGRLLRGIVVRSAEDALPLPAVKHG